MPHIWGRAEHYRAMGANGTTAGPTSGAPDSAQTQSDDRVQRAIYSTSRHRGHAVRGGAGERPAPITFGGACENAVAARAVCSYDQPAAVWRLGGRGAVRKNADACLCEADGASCLNGENSPAVSSPLEAPARGAPTLVL